MPASSPDKVGVFPFRRRDDQLELLLITSRTRRRWVFPKGNLEEDLTLPETAAMEAYEEAGVRGEIREEPVGSYQHGVPPESRCRMYLLNVQEVLDDYPEVDQRRRHWFTIEECKERVFEPELKEMLGRLDPDRAARARD